ncbi:hypothetical protein LCGC14_1767540 [marine sediment metagenome]|uniref:Uncharacterized protein n=1 Tax=marine sediment metagenome TaxID=412755 RepID=A0A0F9HLQ6_9ZZZZ
MKPEIHNTSAPPQPLGRQGQNRQYFLRSQMSCKPSRIDTYIRGDLAAERRNRCERFTPRFRSSGSHESALRTYRRFGPIDSLRIGLNDLRPISIEAESQIDLNNSSRFRLSANLQIGPEDSRAVSLSAERHNTSPGRRCFVGSVESTLTFRVFPGRKREFGAQLLDNRYDHCN